MFQSDRQAYHSRINTRLHKLFIRHLAVGRTCRMQNSRSCVCNMNNNGSDFKFVHKPHSGFPAAFYAEGYYSAAVFGQILFGNSKILIALQSMINKLITRRLYDKLYTVPYEVLPDVFPLGVIIIPVCKSALPKSLKLCGVSASPPAAENLTGFHREQFNLIILNRKQSVQVSIA